MNAIIHHFNFLNGVSQERFSDLTLKTECGSSLSMHKVVAAAISSKLSSQLSSDVNELPVRNVKFPALKNVIDFAYNGKIILSSKSEIEDFATAYKILQINLGPKIEKIIDEVGFGPTISKAFKRSS